jgi:sec-independent protein translocase protein TatA
MGEGLLQPMHLLVIFLIALLVFGPKRLPDLGKGLGEAIRGFKDSLKAGEADRPDKSTQTKVQPDTKGRNGSSEQSKN